MLDEAIELGADAGAHEVVIGMAHRGRLNVLAHTIGVPYEEILREFEGERTSEAVAADPERGSGDVKYHHGAAGTRQTEAGDITVTLAANPSHLEAVDPIVEGRTRAEQTDRSSGPGIHDPRVALPILIHGDASFPAQGIVAETLNLEDLAGYTTGGTLHIIANNQIGFTTDPQEGRSTRYSSDLAKGFDIPIIHVNADDAEAAISAIRLALAFRSRFGEDVVVDLVGYRRHGHNEQDEAAYTQPLMAQKIANHPTVREQFAAELVAEGVITQDDVDAEAQALVGELKSAHETLKDSFGKPAEDEGPTPPEAPAEIVTAVPAEQLRSLNQELIRVPDDFTIHPKLMRQLERRLPALDEGAIDWGQAEALAFATLLVEGIPIRLTGQDTERGTFSHRHLVFHDAHTGERYAPIRNLDEAEASFEVYNSPLSELAAVGFEYGYSVAAPEALVLWEAQFGDFVNGAQVIVDQFIVSGRAKWGQTSRLTLLLPHGYEGNGPEHSSARLERFLQLAAEGNIRVANCSTARPVLPPDPPAGAQPERAAADRDDAEGAAPDEGGRVEPRRADRGTVPPGARRSEGRPRAGASPRRLLREALLRHPRRRRAIPRDRGRAARAAVSVPGRRVRRADQRLPGARGARLGTGGAAEHGRLPRHASSAGAGGRSAPLHRAPVAREHERGLPDDARSRTGADRARGARYGLTRSRASR